MEVFIANNISKADKNDLGAFRFSDPERDVIIASTDLPGLTKAPILYDDVQQKDVTFANTNLRIGNTGTLKPHYSISTRGQQLWGTHDVYTDDLYTEEAVTLKISYN